MFEGSLEVKLPTIVDNMDRRKSRGGKSQRREQQQKEDQRRERIRRKKMQVREKIFKSQNTMFFQHFVAQEGRKVGSLKRRVRSHLARWEMIIARHCGVKHISNMLGPFLDFWSWDVQKVHAFVARSTFPSQNVQSTPASEHFWKLRCRKSARRCGAKHVSKSNHAKHTSFGTLLEVEMSKKCTQLRREAHFEVKSVKNWRSRTTFGLSDVVSHGRRKGLCTLPKISLCAFCRVVVPTKPFTNTALYYEMLLESEPTPPATKCFWGFWWRIKSQCGSLQTGYASGLQWKIMIRY